MPRNRFPGNILPIFLFTVAALISTVVSPFAEELIWPIDSPPSITSSFGEPRPGRFHYGVDLRSGGVTGKEVYAFGDGYISRIRTSPFGYGKMMYINLDSGQSVVYAHLSGFTPEIEDILFNTRIREKSYDVDVWFKSGEHRVTKGQLVAYSGDTGSGGPHLHFEIRDSSNQPLNPLDIGFTVRDTIPPFFTAIALMPLDNASTVDGFPVAKQFKPESLKTIMPVLFGRIGIAVSVWDRTNNSQNLVGVYTLSLSVDSTQVFSKRYSRISYDFNGCGALDYLDGSPWGGNGYLSALFRREGNAVDFYEGNGVLSVTLPELTSSHTITVTARDYSNNTKTISFPVLFGERPAFISCGYDGDGSMVIVGDHPSGRLAGVDLWNLESGNTWTFVRNYPVGQSHCAIKEPVSRGAGKTFKAVLVGEDSVRSLPAIFGINGTKSLNHTEEQGGITVIPELHHDCIIVRITAPAILASLPIVTVEENGHVMDGFFSSVPESPTSWTASIPLPKTGHTTMRIKVSAYDRSLNAVWKIIPLEFTVAGSRVPVKVSAPDSLFTMTVEPAALYRPAPVYIDTVDVKSSNGLVCVTKGYRVVWGDSPIKGNASVSLTLDTEPPVGSALFISSNGNGWHFLSDQRSGLVFNGVIKSPGKIAVLCDTTVPYVRVLEPRPGGVIHSHRPNLRAYIEDRGAGIAGSNSIAMSIDGIPVYGEYDYEANTVSYRIHDDLQTGSHTAEITVTDRVGNAKTRSWEFKIAQ